MPLPRKISDIKRKYHAKTASDSAIFVTWLRSLEAADIFPRIVWLDIPLLDLTELGMGLLYAIAPVDLQPVSVDYTYEHPTVEESLQGIWAKFKPVRFDTLYEWMADVTKYIQENFAAEIQASIIAGSPKKARYGFTMYARGVYDPIVAREFIRATFYRLRLLRKPDPSWEAELALIKEIIDMTGATDRHVYNRLSMIASAQRFAFVLGLSPLGYGSLPETRDGMAVVPSITFDNQVVDLVFRTLDHLQIGLVLGMVPLGMGLLLPRSTVYKLPDGKRNPPILNVMIEKAKGIISRLPLLAFAYSNYNKPEEMRSYHASDKTNQYHALQAIRRHIEEWVEAQVPPEEQNPMRLRQYKNAVLQLVSWKAKRHRWGFNGFKAMTDDEFKDWWLSSWEAQGLNRDVLEAIYGRTQRWLQHIRTQKLSIGERVKRSRYRLAWSL